MCQKKERLTEKKAADIITNVILPTLPEMSATKPEVLDWFAKNYRFTDEDTAVSPSRQNEAKWCQIIGNIVSHSDSNKTEGLKIIKTKGEPARFALSEEKMNEVKKQIEEKKMTENFSHQIDLDIKELQEMYSDQKIIQNKDRAFNIWVLQNVFGMDVEEALDCVTDGNDDGIDCYVWHENKKDLYLIQCKKYSEGTVIRKDYIQNTFLVNPLSVLKNGTYNRSKQLQKIFDENKTNTYFNVHLLLVVSTDSSISDECRQIVRKYNDEKNIREKEPMGITSDAEIIELEDLKKIYFGEEKLDGEHFEYSFLKDKNNGCVVSEKTAWDETTKKEIRYYEIDAPICVVYDMMHRSMSKEHYNINSENIRDFLGMSNKVNKDISKSITDPEQRGLFILKNKGIRIAADHIRNSGNKVVVTNPKIIDGGQTSNVIFEELDRITPEARQNDFRKCKVKVTLCELSEKDESSKRIREDILQSNNNQTAILKNAHNMTSKTMERTQKRFANHGILLAIKDGERNFYKNKEYKNNVTALIRKGGDEFVNFGLDQIKKPDEVILDTPKFMQILMSFKGDAHTAASRKQALLTEGKPEYAELTDFLESYGSETQNLRLLVELYLKVAKEKRIRSKILTIDVFSRIFCGKETWDNPRPADPTLIAKFLSTKEDVDDIVDFLIEFEDNYAEEWRETHQKNGRSELTRNPIDRDCYKIAKKISVKTLPDRLKDQLR